MTKQQVIDSIHHAQDMLSKGFIATINRDQLIGILSDISQSVSTITEATDLDFDTIEQAGYKRCVRASADWLKSNCYLDDEYLDRYIQAML